MFYQIRGMLSTLTFLDILDILIVTFVVYKLYLMIKDTRAVALLKGLMVLLFFTVISKWFELNVIHWLLQKTLTGVFIALPIVFQPELRRALEQIGKGHIFRKQALSSEQLADNMLEEIGKSVEVLSQNKIGALIVFERGIGLNDYIDTGLKVDGIVSSEFLINIFIPNTPMHDGAVIIRDERVMAAGCLLPLTEDRSLNKELGTRHRAAIGITEQTDSIVVIVSEETGTISYAFGGQLVRYLNKDTLKQKLRPLFITKQASSWKDMFSNWRQ